MLHPLVRWLSRRSLRWFYREIRVVGSERLPRSGPVMLVLNHGNDLPDVLVGFVASTRDVRYVATVSAAESRLGGWTYRGLGVVPVTRIRDARRLKGNGADAAAMNSAAFARVVDALRQGSVVGIFPEGGVPNVPYLAHFKAGMAKMALQAFDDGAIKRIQVLPLGIQYEAPDRARSDLVVVVGEAIDLDSWHSGAHGSRHKELTQEAFVRLRAITRNAPTEDALQLLNRVLAAVAALERLPGEVPLESAERIRRCLADAPHGMSHAEDGSPHGVLVHRRRELEQAASAQCDVVARLGGRAESARDHAHVVAAAGVEAECEHLEAPGLLRLLLRAPLAAAGWVMHAIPFGITISLADRLAIGPSERAARAVLPGLFVVLGWYLVVAIAGVTVGGWRWLLLIVVLPRLGDAAVSWRDDVATWRLWQRVRRWNPAERRELRAQSSALRAAWRGVMSAISDIRESSHTKSSVVSVLPAAQTDSPAAASTATSSAVHGSEFIA